MNRKLLIVLGVLIVFWLAWFSLMGFINSRSATVNVTVSGSVDEVTFYEASSPEVEVARIVTNGQEQQQTLRLPATADYSFWRQMPPAQYHFVIHQAGQTHDDGPICCTVGLRPAAVNLIIHGLSEWEQSTD